jgi:hypothetical protein
MAGGWSFPPHIFCGLVMGIFACGRRFMHRLIGQMRGRRMTLTKAFARR